MYYLSAKAGELEVLTRQQVKMVFSRTGCYLSILLNPNEDAISLAKSSKDWIWQSNAEAPQVAFILDVEENGVLVEQWAFPDAVIEESGFYKNEPWLQFQSRWVKHVCDRSNYLKKLI